jgi:hypothetical protein
MSAHRSRRVLTLTAIAVSALLAGSASAQVNIYPQRGQSAEQQQRDRFECHQFAVQQTGFDPTMGAQRAPSGTALGGAGRGAATGAAIGAIGGAIGGSAGRGAAIGAGAGAVFGGLRRNSQIRDSQQANNAQVDAFNRALGACLTGRGYTVF